MFFGFAISCSSDQNDVFAFRSVYGESVESDAVTSCLCYSSASFFSESDSTDVKSRQFELTNVIGDCSGSGEHKIFA